MTNFFTRARSICGSCSGKSGTLSADASEGDAGGTDAVIPGCAIRRRCHRAPATAKPLVRRNLFRERDVFMSASLCHADEKYFSNIAIFLGYKCVPIPPQART